MSAPTIQQTHPTFQAKIARLADLSGKTGEEIYARWRGYTEDACGFDQSPLLWEFVDWQKEWLGVDVNAAREAVA